MFFASILALVAIGGATLLTYFYYREELLWWRLCTGVCVGTATLGLTGFILASWLGMTLKTLGATMILNSLPLLLLRQPVLRARVVEDFNESLATARRAASASAPKSWIVPGFYVAAATLFWYVCSRTMFENVAGLFTGMDTNIGDLPFHLAVINGFVQGQNFPPQHPEFAGASLTYPFVEFIERVVQVALRDGYPR